MSEQVTPQKPWLTVPWMNPPPNYQAPLAEWAAWLRKETAFAATPYDRDIPLYAFLRLIKIVEGARSASPIPEGCPFEWEREVPPLCPKCGKPQAIKRNRHSGDWFQGCSNFPSCDFSQGLQHVKRVGTVPTKPGDRFAGFYSDAWDEWDID